ncbi:MAG: nucleoside kinase [Clostridia bacterium]|nr:nucleoside kinase [Clostridia bacterium]
MADLNNKLEYVNEKAKSNSKDFILECEKRYQSIIDKIVKKIIEEDGREIIMLAGPSSAGKTTTAKRLKEGLGSKGVTTYVLSLDDFYLNREDIPYLPDGSQDYETVHALDLERLENDLNSLLRGETVKTPVFDFTTGRRSDTEFNTITLGQEDVVIIEGLHALNPIITDKVHGKLLKVYINVSSRIYDENCDLVLNKRNFRFLRRMIRDYKFRASSVDNTYKLWKNVTAGEEKYLFPYRDNADIKANTVHLYEPCVIKNQALPLLRDSEVSVEFREDAEKLCASLERFFDIDENEVPKDSLLREFLG